MRSASLPVNRIKITIMLNKILLFFLLLIPQFIIANNALSKEAEVIFVYNENDDMKYAEEIQLACDLLGVKLKTHSIRTIHDTKILTSNKNSNDKDVLILTERVLKYFNKGIVSLFGHSVRKANILILGINSNTDIADMKKWSDNRIKNFRKFDLMSISASIRVIKNDSISKELGGLEYPLISSGSVPISGFELEESGESISLIELADGSGKPVCPIFLKIDSAKISMFFLSSWEKIIALQTNKLLNIMPILMFLKYSFGDRCWHGSHDYANLIIDDPWLREPYGYISFKELCREAKKGRFHVTIGFIPYYYLRSHDDAVDIFRRCQDNLSIAVHGNNHDFSEFQTSGKEKLNDKKLSNIHPDEKNVLQSLYRMDTFSQRTGLHYDRVMIFPRGDFTKESLEQLKKHNFLMTVNSTRPKNTEHLSNNSDRMRGVTLEFENFPLVMRRGVTDWKNDKRAMVETKNLIQMRLFLDLPVFLYTHHAFFKDGADEFNEIASIINKTQPEVIWTNLGNIAQNLYLQKRIGDNEIEIMAYSSDIIIKNGYPFSMKYIIKKKEDFTIPIQSVEVDGVRYKFCQDGNDVKIEVEIEPGCKKNIRILYHSDYQVGSFTYLDNSVRVYIIRTLSDFRDLYISKLPFGDKMVQLFYKVGGIKNVLIGLSVLLVIILILLLRLYQTRKFKKAQSNES
jgi:hypothetical protein